MPYILCNNYIELIYCCYFSKLSKFKFAYVSTGRLWLGDWFIYNDYNKTHLFPSSPLPLQSEGETS